MKIYIDNDNLLNPIWYRHRAFIDIEKNRWTYTDNINEATIIPIVGRSGFNIEFLKNSVKDHHILMILDVFDINDSGAIEGLTECLEITNKVIFIHKNYKLKDDPRFVYFDCLWDRQKLYCTEYKKVDNLGENSWTRGANPEIYQISDIDKQPSKKFLSPQRIYPGNDSKTKIRRLLQTFLEGYSEQGYISYVGTNGTVLGTNNDSTILNYVNDSKGGVWYPVADSYYNSSYISIYAETLVTGYNANCVTEKSFDPLIKGNFILPFGYQGLIKHLTDYYGFKLPRWVDYSYDNIKNTYDRFGRYLNVVEHILNYSAEDLHELYLKDKDILEHNRNIFYTRPYCGIYDNVLEFIETQGWST